MLILKRVLIQKRIQPLNLSPSMKHLPQRQYLRQQLQQENNII